LRWASQRKGERKGGNLDVVPTVGNWNPQVPDLARKPRPAYHTTKEVQIPGS